MKGVLGVGGGGKGLGEKEWGRGGVEEEEGEEEEDDEVDEVVEVEEKEKEEVVWWDGEEVALRG
jgi:hypothetical protein